MAKQIPVYLFTGFLEAGKTKFIQETMEDPRFNDGERTLLLLCEEGVEEYDPSRFHDSKNVFIETLEEPEEINEIKLTSLVKKHRAERVVLEYNGMWLLQDLYNRMPENWMIYQEFMLCDSNTFLAYNQNMRQLVVDKLSSCEIVVFNRAKKDVVDKETFHKIVRGVSRRTDIAYEYENGDVEYDDIQDPLPFDIEAPVIEIKDEDFALFYRDISEESAKYNGKTVHFKGMVALDKRFPKGMIAIGRFVMTCCEADTQYMSFLCQVPKDNRIAHKDWVDMTATIEVKHHPLYQGTGPILTSVSFGPASAPVQEVATFY